ncbi:hypothetical protein AAVH_23146 [Aphelenchoides avenae]|nr:hypothetical protein AAVH_23146 [Aphelenchus avenae]
MSALSSFVLVALLLVHAESRKYCGSGLASHIGRVCRNVHCDDANSYPMKTEEAQGIIDECCHGYCPLFAVQRLCCSLSNQ